MPQASELVARTGRSLPHVIGADAVGGPGLDHLIGWLARNAGEIDAAILKHGAVMLRGFPIATTEDFARLLEPMTPFGLSYAGGATPRAAIKGRVYEASRVSAQMRIMLHQEMAYLPHYPGRLAFFCQRPAESGGATTVGDMRAFTARLPRHLREAVESRGVMHTRNFRAPHQLDGRETPVFNHRTWQEAFYTDDPAEAEAACRAQDLEFHWLDDGSLSVVHRAPGFVDHPATGERVWFNHFASQVIHPRWMKDAYPAFHAVYGNNLPRPTDTRYGDGGRIADADFEAIHDLLDAITVDFPWQKGDVLLLDNILTAHGRSPYIGDRDVQVSLLA